MDIHEQDLFRWQCSAVPDQPVDLISTPSSSRDKILFEPQTPPSYHAVISSIEEDDTNDLRDDPSNTHNHGFGSDRVDNTFSCQQLHAGATRLDTSSSELEANPYEGWETAPELPITNTPKERPITIEIPQSTLTQPKSLFQGFIPPTTQVDEAEALSILSETIKSQQSLDDYVEFDLHDFCIYLNSELYPYELRSLQHLATRQFSDYFCFDGVLGCGEQRFFLKRIPFQQLPIGNYGIEEHTVGDQIWIRSELNEKRNHEVYYKLRSPSSEYIRFHEPFLWIVDLTKHVLDYCDYSKENGRRVVLYDFKSNFSVWALRNHGKSATFKRWHSANRSSDFRGAIIANVEFIWKEAHGLDSKTVLWHGFWDEIKTLNRYKPNLKIGQAISDDSNMVRWGPLKPRKNGPVSPTIVTPYIHDLFSHMLFGNVLKQVSPSISIEKKRAAFVQTSRPNEKTCPPAVKRKAYDHESSIASIIEGDVISTRPDDESTDTEWKQQKSKHCEGEHLWFGLVQKIHKSPKGRRSFDVIWLYQPIDTPCGIMKYPWNNELFLSNNCTCHHGTARVQADQILSTHDVEWFGNPSTTAEFFVRQTYLSDDCRWTTLKREHLTCEEDRFHKKTSYNVGDAVLVETDPKALQLETFIVEGFFDEGNKHYVRLRKLLRRRDVDKIASNSPPNELVYTNQFVEISSRRIFRHCLVRAFRPEENIPRPYDFNGTGNLFFITHQEVETEEGQSAYVPLDMNLVHGLRLGFDPSEGHRSQKLQGLDLFCGGGNFGRGLEDGGAIEMRWVNDIWHEAIHTYMANCKTDTCTPFLGSVDDLLLQAMQGNNSKVPQPGDVQFLSAGSPCPGFSILTPDRTTDDQRKNQSLVASFASYVDLYRPYYGILENVPQMVNSRNFRDTCVFSQLVCALVGLGYQVQVMFLDAWSFGAPQSRSRVFLVFSAPGFRMPKVPAPSHSHPPGTRLTKLGEMSCGRPFDRRVLLSTPFRYVSARESIADLPDIRDAKPDFCVGFPDHRLSIGFTPPMRKQLSLIPIHPWGMNFSKAWYGRPDIPPVLSESDRHHLYPPMPADRVLRPSRGWGRIHPNGLFGTIATRCPPTDARIGAINHWEQSRPLTILEIRRAQGFPDDDLIVGPPVTQWRIVGNSVARQVSVALGLAVREAWYGTLFDEAHVPQTGLGLVPGGSLSVTQDIPSGNFVVVENGLEEIKEAEIDSPGSTMPSEDLLQTSVSLQNSLPLTPITMGSVEFSDSEGSSRKRPSLPVEVLAKRQRLYTGYREVMEKSLAIEYLE
ncbi:S-adenosyl-L-methionine-dependent methyltransferase [Daldinia vernicosa]|uniref:S-adenosyl-L-methionine-dependent methyltransferase n=1 Tax=Daldinia vernicosa TaxID=114800 RepID=UPI002007BA4E|nr:S-adenosyl-L-methionine-dependent methyltransferase [Daldinia vernicosa]KAI0845012.1 S-adenosyl-L-methionine-dependent methyltransferase [Daldinia vernicosa]